MNSMSNLFYMYIDNVGGLIYKRTSRRYGSAFDIAYDAADHKVYLIGKYDAPPSDVTSLIAKIDVATGNIDYQKAIEGLSNGWPFPHAPWAYKIEVNDDKLFLFGYVRAYNLNSSRVTQNIMIPFRAELNKSDASEVNFVLNHSDTIHTIRYPSEDPQFLNAWDNLSAVFSNNYPSVYTPEMGLIYFDNDNQIQWGMIGYFDQTGVPFTYDLHFMNSENGGECNSLEKDLFIPDLPVVQTTTLYVELPVETFDMNIQRFTLTFDDENCN